MQSFRYRCFRKVHMRRQAGRKYDHTMYSMYIEADKFHQRLPVSSVSSERSISLILRPQNHHLQYQSPLRQLQSTNVSETYSYIIIIYCIQSASSAISIPSSYIVPRARLSLFIPSRINNTLYIFYTTSQY